MKSKFVNTFATILGGLLSAISWVMYMITYILFQVEEVFQGSEQAKLVTFLFFLIIPFTLLTILVQLKVIEDPDTRDKKQRIIMMSMFLLSNLFLLLYAWEVGLYDLVKLVLLLIFPGLFVIIVNKFWLLSIHTATNAASVTTMAYLSGGLYYWLYVLVIFVAWSRLREKKHNLAQVIAGGLVGTLVTYVLLSFFFTPGQFS